MKEQLNYVKVNARKKMQVRIFHLKDDENKKYTKPQSEMVLGGEACEIKFL